ncbi:cytidine deaminase [Pseudomonas stutzeri]|uniref:cytidine deaminase n=1 Tax=Stutzerimonas TaxID=2901164 RepID=UPI000BA8D483|nr:MULTISPECIES: cytidine deaminase [Stutzerimonas]MBA4689713.1 cytidine deaminase [Pseudomonas sp.]MCF0014985.1 cytidine deaminase [Stutzerimonas stutzeri]MCF0020392.1 cytidine deaminase [Stutzerimonas stutzeri]MDH0102111.1 cytidine deaminase [Stutzerimonas stutzeri]MDH0182143.1 cytidine deaminase [Stutzerimonas stutzeri]
MSSKKETIDAGILPLLDAAKRAAENAYCVYSQFPVGAALLTADGTTIVGCNVENASFGLTNCAERAALCAAISQGYAPRSFKALVVYAPKMEHISPCGACRQVISELLAPDCPVCCCGSDTEQYRVWSSEELLPGAFSF